MEENTYVKYTDGVKSDEAGKQLLGEDNKGGECDKSLRDGAKGIVSKESGRRGGII